MMGHYARICGAELARAHARAGDAIAIASYLGHKRGVRPRPCPFAESYADQNERDYKTLTKAVDSKAIEAETGV